MGSQFFPENYLCIDTYRYIVNLLRKDINKVKLACETKICIFHSKIRTRRKAQNGNNRSVGLYI